jgi:hypothetical protein
MNIRFDVLHDSPLRIVVRDLSENEPRARSLTNGAEELLKRLSQAGRLRPGKRVMYFDTEGRLDEMTHEHAVFRGFRALSDLERATIEMEMKRW